MAKVYQATRDVSIPKPVAKLDPSKEDSDWVVEGVTYPAGSLISEEWLTPRDRKRAENGELSYVLHESDQDLPEGYVAEGGFVESERGVFIAEHEAEATALAMGGHVVVPKEQQMELLSSSLSHEREYQQAVKEQGYDKRPNVEAMQKIGTERVPDEILMGGETPTGLPHHRGAPGRQEDALQANKEEVEENQNEDQDNSQDQGGSGSTRAAPGSSESREQADKSQQATSQTVGSGAQNPQGGQPQQSEGKQ